MTFTICEGIIFDEPRQDAASKWANPCAVTRRGKKASYVRLLTTKTGWILTTARNRVFGLA